MPKQTMPKWRIIAFAIPVVLAGLGTFNYIMNTQSTLSATMASLAEKTTKQDSTLLGHDVRIRANEQFRAAAVAQLENIDKHMIMQSDQLRWIRDRLETSTSPTPRWP